MYSHKQTLYLTVSKQHLQFKKVLQLLPQTAAAAAVAAALKIDMLQNFGVIDFFFILQSKTQLTKLFWREGR